MEGLENIILNNKNLIYSIAQKFNRPDLMDDLFQVGAIGMIEAYYNFDETKGVKFTSYAYTYIFGAIMTFVRENNAIKISKDLSKVKSKLEKARALLAQKLMMEPSIFQLSEYLEIPVEDLERLESLNVCSLDETYGDERNLYEMLFQNNLDINDYVFLKNELEALEEPERTIMFERYFSGMTQGEVADNLGLTQVNVSRREKKVLTKLRKTYN